MTSKWVEFIDVTHSYPNSDKKTCTWAVWEKNGGVLGQIKWFSHWRQYVFAPVEDTVFNVECMADIAAFIIEHKKDRNVVAVLTVDDDDERYFIERYGL